MTDTWDRTTFDKELKGLLHSKLPISASKITALQNLATSNPKHHNYIVQCITRFIETSPADYRLAGLYVIDAISRAAYKQQRKREETNEGPTDLENYLKRFAIVLKDDSLKGCFEPCTVKDKEKVKKTLDFWEQGNIYPKDVVDYVKHSFLNAASSSLPDKVASPLPPLVDTAQLLATLSNIGNGSLSNLNIPGITAPKEPAVKATTEEKPLLPPALAKLLGGLVNTPPTQTPSSPPPPQHVSHDPRMSTQDMSSTQKGVWPPPQGPSIPKKVDKKSRWNANQEPSYRNNNSWSPPQQQTYYPPSQYHNQSMYIQPQYNQPQSYQYNPQQPGPIPGTQPFADHSLPPGCIRVLTRTLFIGPIPDYYDKNEVSQLFSKYGDIASIIVSKKTKGRHNAFLKFKTRAATELAKYESEGLMVENVPVKVNWGFGFGPKKHFNYDRGDSIIPLSELSHEEKENLVTAPVGGFQGQTVRELMTIEEPEAPYRPEWKNSDKRPNMDDMNHTKKRTRFNNNNNNNDMYYDNRQQFYQQNKTSFTPSTIP